MLATSRCAPPSTRWSWSGASRTASSCSTWISAGTRTATGSTGALVEPLCRAGWRVVVLSGSSDAGRIGGALAAGGFVWVPKNAPFPTLLAAIREAREGRWVIPAGRRHQLIEIHRHTEDERREIAAKLEKLTPREREVLGLLAAGRRAQGVADHFVVSLATVRTQIRAVLTKLEVGSQLEAVALYRRTQGR